MKTLMLAAAAALSLSAGAAFAQQDSSQMPGTPQVAQPAPTTAPATPGYGSSDVTSYQSYRANPALQQVPAPDGSDGGGN